MSNATAGVTHIHKCAYSGDKLTIEYTRSNELGSTDFAVLGASSHTSIMPTYSDQILAYEGNIVDRSFRKRVLPQSVSFCGLDQKNYSSYLYVKQREHARQIGKLLAEETDNGCHIDRLKEYMACGQAICENTSSTNGCAHALQLSSDQCAGFCKSKRPSDVYRPNELSGRLFF